MYLINHRTGIQRKTSLKAGDRIRWFVKDKTAAFSRPTARNADKRLHFEFGGDDKLIATGQDNKDRKNISMMIAEVVGLKGVKPVGLAGDDPVFEFV